MEYVPAYSAAALNERKFEKDSDVTGCVQKAISDKIKRSFALHASAE